VRRLIILLAAGLLTVLAAQPAAAQAGTSYPSGSIILIPPTS
jgi:ABC-type sugar transport system substrate-binding protein